jgi:hypothetical protein
LNRLNLRLPFKKLRLLSLRRRLLIFLAVLLLVSLRGGIKKATI